MREKGLPGRAGVAQAALAKDKREKEGGACVGRWLQRIATNPLPPAASQLTDFPKNVETVAGTELRSPCSPSTVSC